MDSLAYFKHTAAKLFNPEIGTWKQNGGRVIGTQCSGIPEEVIHAAGILPVRVRAPGLSDTKHADAHLHRINCSYTRSVLESLMLGEMDFLDGFAATNTCDHHLRLVNEVADKSGFPFFYYFQMPHTLCQGAREWFIQETRNLIQAIESSFGITVSEDKLKHTLSVYNQTRSLMAKLNKLRANRPLPLTGAEYLAIALTGISIPREIFNRKLDVLIREIEGRSVAENHLPRLLILGGACDAPEFIEFIESKGAMIVADGMCFGLRHYMGMIDEENDDPVAAIADRYMNRIPCPSIIDGFDRTYEVLTEIISEMDVDGVVCARLKFCDHFAGTRKLLADRLRRDGSVPVVELEREYNTTKSGQLSTRIQAFLELL